MFPNGKAFWTVDSSSIKTFDAVNTPADNVVWEGKLLDVAAGPDDNVEKVELQVMDCRFIDEKDKKPRFVISATSIISSKSVTSMAVRTSRQYELIVYNLEDQKIER